MDIKLLKFETIDSTSTYLRTYIQENYQSIGSNSLICVISSTQTQGKGTQGKTWQSPKGNLYLSFCIKLDTSILDLRYISLDIADLIISFFKENYHIGLYQKWPNDIYFNSSKLSGILSESFKLEDSTFLLVGIGININNIDSINSSTLKVPPISLSKILNHPVNLEEFEDNFINYLNQHIENITSKTNLTTTLSYSNFYSSNYPFLSLKDNFIYYLDYAKDYSNIFLKKQPYTVDKDDSIKILSVDENIIPLYSKAYPFIGADLGNSRVKLFLYKTSNDIEPSLYRAFDIDRLEEQGFSSFIKDLSYDLDSIIKESDISSSINYSKYPIHTISVSDTNYKKLISYFSSSKFTLIPTTKRSVYLSPSYSTLGIDRCAIMEACIKLYLSTTNNNIAVLSLGTATTIDLISKDRRHLGGFILPGINSQLSLLSNCANLPSLDIEPDSYSLFKDKDIISFLGDTTNSSMINGVLYNTISLINNISSNFLVPNDTLVLTGGWSSFIFNLLNSFNKDNKIIPSNITIVSNEYLSSLGTKILTVNG